MVVVTKAEYHPDGEMVVWECKLPDGSTRPMRWPRLQFGQAMGMKNVPDTGVPADILIRTMPGWVGKQLELVIRHETTPTLSDRKEIARAFKQFSKSLRRHA